MVLYCKYCFEDYFLIDLFFFFSERVKKGKLD